MRLRRISAVAALLLLGQPAHADKFFDDFVAGRPVATTPLGATDAMPVIQGGQTRRLFPQSYFMRPDGSNATLPNARAAILPTPTLNNCLVGNGSDWTSASCPGGVGGMDTSGSNAVLPAARTNLGAAVAGGIWPGSLGGTGVDNTGKSIALGGNLVTGGALTSTGTGPTTLAFPSSSATYTFPSATATLMSNNGSNATLPDARTNLGASVAGGVWPITLGGTGAATGSAARDNVLANGNQSFRTPADFGAKCDVAYPTGLTIGAASNVLTGTATTFTAADIGKLVLLPGHSATGGVLHTSIIGISGANAVLANNSVPGTTKQFTEGAQLATRGTLYVPGDTITIAGGTFTVATVLTVKTTAVAATPGIVAGGTGGTNGAQQIYGTTGNGNRFVLNVTITGGALASINSIADAGHYGTNPTSLAVEPVAGAGLTGASVSVVMGVDLVGTTTPGIYTNGAYPTSPASQASTSGSGTGATFNLETVYNSQAFVYGTDDSAAFNTALASSGSNVQMPNRSCGIGSTILIPGNRTWLIGEGHQGNLERGAAPTGSVLQWLGADGGVMLTASPPGVPPGFYNRVSGITFQCAIPKAVASNANIMVAGTGLNLLSQEGGEWDNLAFDECSNYDIYGGPNAIAGNFQHNRIHDIFLMNNGADSGFGIYLTGELGSNPDADYNRVYNIFSSYRNRASLQVVTLDNNKASQLHFFERPGNLDNIYGIDISGKTYGMSGANQRDTLLLEQISSTSIVRGLESSASPPRNILIFGFDTSNSVPVIVERPGSGPVSYMDYNGNTKIGGILTTGGALTGVGNITTGGVSPTSQTSVTANRSDYSTSFASTYFSQFGASATGTRDTLPNANLGDLTFQNTTNALIRTNGAARLYFGTQSTLRGYFGHTADGGGLVMLGTSINMPTGGFVGFQGTTALTSSNYSLSGSGANTYLNAGTGGNAELRVNNASILRATGAGTAVVVGTITGIPTPSAASDAVPKSYADSIAAGIVTHAAVAASTTAAAGNLTATASGTGPGKTLTNSGAQAAFATDGYSGLINDRILVKNQTLSQDNGIYTLTTVGTGATNWVLTRATDFDAASAGEVAAGASVIVIDGTANAASNWVETGQGPFTLETTPIVFTKVVGDSAGTVVAGTANQLGYYASSGTAISGLTSGNDGVLATNGSGVPAITSTLPNAVQDNVTRLGTIATGVWNGTTIALGKGGTGADLSATGGTSQVLKQVSAGAGISVGTLGCADLSTAATGCSTTVGTAATQNTGTSGSAIPVLDGVNTWAGSQSFSSGGLLLRGATSGTTTLNAAATAGTTTLTLPAGTTNFSATGGANQVVKQAGAGAAFTVGQVAAAEVSGLASSATSDTTNATNITSGTLALARLPTFAHTQRTVAADAGTTNVTGLMMGLAGTITPTASGTVRISVCGDNKQTVIGSGVNTQLRTGTGAAPTVGAALTGTTRGSLARFVASTVAGKTRSCLQWTIAGLALSTAVWIDVGRAAVTSGTATFSDVDIVADEIP